MVTDAFDCKQGALHLTQASEVTPDHPCCFWKDTLSFAYVAYRVTDKQHLSVRGPRFMHKLHTKQASCPSYDPSPSRKEHWGWHSTLPLVDKQQKRGDDLLASRFAYENICLHSGLLNWLQNRLEMVFLLYTSHNSPSHQPVAIFYLGDDISIRICQPLTVAPWVVVFQKSIVNQDNINEISLAGAGQPSAWSRHFIRWLLSQNTYRRSCLDTLSVWLSIFLCFFHPLSSLHRDTEEFTDLTKMGKRDTGTETEIGQRGHSCQPILTSFNILSKAQAARKG